MAVIFAILKNLGVNLALNDCVFDNIGCIFASQWMYFCQSVDVKMPVLDVFMAVILCITVLLAIVYKLTNIHPDVFLPVVKMPCTLIFKI